MSSHLIKGDAMNSDTDITYGHKETFIAFESLAVNEEIIIETQNSFYKFSIGDAAERRGFLYGGSVGSRGCVAILMGAVKRQGEDYINDPCGLHTDARAFFYIETEDGMKHLITSLITSLAHVRQEESGELFS
jgi:hypothetical protein